MRFLPLLSVLVISSLFAGSALASDHDGLIYLHHRLLDPSIGRFTSADPANPSGNIGSNKYAYGNNSPATNTDPSGMRAWGMASDPRNYKVDNGPFPTPPNFAGSGPNKFVPGYIGNNPNPSQSEQIKLAGYSNLTFSVDYSSWIALRSDSTIGAEWTARIDAGEQKAAEIDRRLVAYQWLIQVEAWQKGHPGSEVPYSTQYDLAKSATQDLPSLMIDYDEYTYNMIEDSKHDNSPGALTLRKITAHKFQAFTLTYDFSYDCGSSGLVDCGSYSSFVWKGRHFLLRGLLPGLRGSEWFGRHPEAWGPVTPGQPKPTPTPATTGTPTPTPKSGPTVRTQQGGFSDDVGSRRPGALR